MKQLKSEIIIEYCQSAARPVSAREVLDAHFPNKTQSYINDVINQLVAKKIGT